MQPKISFKQQMLLAREGAIIAAANQLLAEKGFDLMTLEEVARAVGISKASLYKHFDSKESLAAATMAVAIGKAKEVVDRQPAKLSATAKLREVVRWVMGLALSGQMPSLPSQNSSLRAALLHHKAYVDGLMAVSDTLGGWIETAQAEGKFDAQLPPLVILYTLYARACDPVLEFLKMSGQYSDEQIIDWVLCTCFEGINARKPAKPR